MQKSLSLVVAALLFFSSQNSGAKSDPYRVGAGIYDITGPSAEVGMMGYGQVKQVVGGIQTRLWSRAFVIEAPDRSSLVTLVTTDLCFVPGGVRDEVITRMNKVVGYPRYSYQNLLIQATHTHSGPGGYSHRSFYDFTTMGLIQQNFETIVAGIVQSILRAERNREPAKIFLQVGTLKGASINRSPESHLTNPDARTTEMTNSVVTQLKFVSTRGRPIGLINWFAVHATSINNQNSLIHSDNKGVAALRFEKEMGSNPLVERGFVAAFANSDEGDSSPHIEGLGEEMSNANLDVSANLQWHKARELFFSDNSHEITPSAPHSAHRFVHMPDLLVSPQFTGLAEDTALCHPAFGVSFAAGAEDGPGGVGLREGIRVGDDLGHGIFNALTAKLLSWFPGGRFFGEDACHGNKRLLISVGRHGRHTWTPENIPFQIIRLGQLAVIAVPAEITTEVGRRLRSRVLIELQNSGVTHAVISGLANDYSSYVSTPSEYATQSYEGASTLFGPWTSAAYEQEYSKLARELMGEKSNASDAGPEPILWRDERGFRPGVVFDSKYFWEEFGEQLVAPQKAYRKGDTVKVIFRAGHPKNDLMTMRGYLEIQKFVDGPNAEPWQTVAYDWDPETRFIWTRDSVVKGCSACSRAQIEWDIPADATSGIYRVLHRGARRSVMRNVYPYSGLSDTFIVE